MASTIMKGQSTTEMHNSSFYCTKITCETTNRQKTCPLFCCDISGAREPSAVRTHTCDL